MVNIIGIPVGIFTSIVITRYLGAKAFGDFNFVQDIFNLAIVLFSFGFFEAGNRAMVLSKDKQKTKELYGAELVITGALFVLMSLFLLAYALLDNNLHAKQLDKFLIYVIPFGWVFMLTNYFEKLFQADNQIRMLSQFRLYPKLGFLIGALLIIFVFKDIEVNRLAVVYALNLLTAIVVYFVILRKINISFRNLKDRLKDIWYYNKKFGFNVYIGSFVAVGFNRLTGILISYFGMDNVGVGLYSLALTFARPLSFIPNTIATTHYKDFAQGGKIPRRLLLITIGLSVSTLIMLWILVPPFVSFFYGQEFHEVIWLNFIVSFGVLLYGFGDFFNRFLGANGQGVALRNSSFVVGSCMMLFNLVLIPKWGAGGAAYAGMLNGFVYALIILFYYFKFVSKPKSKES